MLMKTFRTARELYIAPWEQENLIEVLRMLETGEIPSYLFNMGTRGNGCGTPACIGGWVARLQGLDERIYVESCYDSWRRHPLYRIFWDETSGSITRTQAATALRNFLTVGDPLWNDVIPRR